MCPRDEHKSASFAIEFYIYTFLARDIFQNGVGKSECPATDGQRNRRQSSLDLCVNTTKQQCTRSAILYFTEKVTILFTQRTTKV